MKNRQVEDLMYETLKILYDREQSGIKRPMPWTKIIGLTCWFYPNGKKNLYMMRDLGLINMVEEKWGKRKNTLKLCSITPKGIRLYFLMNDRLKLLPLSEQLRTYH